MKGKKNDRRLIQKFKRETEIKKKIIYKIDKQIIQELMEELKRNPLKNVTWSKDKWWDCDADQSLKYISPNDGKLRSIDDFINIIEFIYRVRNNLFHGKKGLNFKRDLRIVEYGFKILNPLMEILIKSKYL